MGSERARASTAERGEREADRSRSQEPEKQGPVLELGRAATALAAAGPDGHPPSPKQVLSLQRLAGNRATTRLMVQRNPTVTTPQTPQDFHTHLKGHEEKATLTEGMSSQVNNVSNILSIPSGVAGTITGANSSNTVQGGGGVGTGGIGTIVSGVALGVDIKDLHHRTQQYNKVKKDPGKKGLKRFYGRNKNIAEGNVTSDVGGVLSGGSSVMSGGVNIASGLGTATTAAAGTAGVVGAAITTPIQLALMIRQIRRAELQRQRMSRLQAERKNLKAKSPTEALKEKQDNYNVDKAALDKLDQDLVDLKKKHADSVQALSKMGTDLTLKLGLARQRMQVTGGDEDDPETQVDPKSQLDEIDQQKKTINDNQKAIDDLQALRDTANQKLLASRAELDGQVQINTTLEDEGSKSGALTDTGEKEKKVPSLQEIADYAIKKNKTGWARRGIGAGAAGVGAIAGGIGIAAAVETFKGNSGLGTDLGIAAGAVAGLAAIVGIGVGIWKLVNWAKKRKSQAKKMEEAHKKDPTQPLPKGTYNPFKSNVDQTTERKHMATALYNYGVHGTPDQQSEAFKIMKALDKKLDWAKELKHDKTTHQVEKDAIIAHFANKMGSGG